MRRWISHRWVQGRVPAAAIQSSSAIARLLNATALNHSSSSQPQQQQGQTQQYPKRLVALGDIHGDCDKFVLALRAANLIDASHRWTGGATTFVQTGDLVDRGAQDKEVLDLIMGLQEQAPSHGGKVVALLGNHDEMARRGREDYVSKASLAAFGGAEKRRAAMGPEGKYGKWLAHLPVCHVEMRTVFVHAFLSPSLVGGKDHASSAQSSSAQKKAFKSVEELNSQAIHLHKSLTQLSASATQRPGPELFALYDTILGGAGPVWRRPVEGHREDSEEHDYNDLLQTLKLLDADRMVVGHTPISDRFHRDFGGKLIIIDNAMSRWMSDSPPTLLELTQKSADAHIVERDIVAK